MDTNDLTEKTYEVLTIAEGIDHIVTVHLGTICSRQSTENEFLQEALEFVQGIVCNPMGFLENWGLVDVVDYGGFTQSMISLSNHIERIGNSPQRLWTNN